MTETASRRQTLRAALVAAADRTIARDGLGALRARALADEAGCALGAIYNVFADLDELVLAVNSRTLAALEEALLAATPKDAKPRDADEAIARMVSMALAYVDFAAAGHSRWRAVFEHRLPVGREVPDWYRAQQRQMFDHLDPLLRTLEPDMTPAERALLARSVFSAVHGMVALGLETTLQLIPLPVLREQVTLVVRAVGRGLEAGSAARGR